LYKAARAGPSALTLLGMTIAGIALTDFARGPYTGKEGEQSLSDECLRFCGNL